MENNIKLILIGILSLWLGYSTAQMYKDNKTEQELTQQMDSLKAERDSLYGEISTKDIDLGRYEIIMDRMWELDSSAVEKATKNLE